tara:strand:- start:37 stop:801 length:765 start_codon:yes stop_codon:yes gene_type:complete
MVKAQLLNPATTSHFQVSVSFLEGGFNQYRQELGLNLDQGRLNILCSDASLPGSAFATSELNNNIPGIRERHVYRRNYDDSIDLTFYCDADQYLPIRFFEAWMNYISGMTSAGYNRVKNEDFHYRVKFPRQYRGNLEITKFEKNLDSRRQTKILTYKFVNCFPLAINSMPVSYDQSQLLKCTARMAYSRYFIEDRPRGVIPRFLNALGSRGGRQGPEFNNGLEVPSNPAFGFGSRTDNFVRIDSRLGERRSGTR